jgi:hypothetical protein
MRRVPPRPAATGATATGERLEAIAREQDAMHARVLTFSRLHDVDQAVVFLHKSALPVLKEQFGFRGVSAGADRKEGVMMMLSLWANESALESSNRPLVEAREQALALSGASLIVEHFEQVSESLARPPAAGGALMLTRFRVEPGSLDEKLMYFEREFLPELIGLPGFCSVRNLVDRYSGRGVTETSWEGQRAMKSAEAELSRSRPGAAEQGISFGETAHLEVLLFEQG